MKAITLIQVLLLQKPSKRSKTKDHICHLKRRLDLWYKGDLRKLLEEGRCIQNRLISRRASCKNDIDGHIFRSLMAQGKVWSALSYLSCEQNGGVLGLDDIIPQTHGLTTRDVLRDKHHTGIPACPESLIQFNPIIYCNLDAECILSVALHGLDAYAWLMSLLRVRDISVVMSWLRCKLSFAAIRSTIMCIRGSRSSTHRPVQDADITLATSEGFVPLQD